MGVYRQIKVSFWTDSYVVELLPDVRNLFMYLFSNPQTTQCGIYELSLRMISMQFGYSLDLIQQWVNTLVTDGKILYDPETHEFLIVNWMKHNPPDNQNMLACVKKEIRFVKSRELFEAWKQINPSLLVSEPFANPSRTVTKPLPNPLASLCTRRKEKEEEKTEEEQERSVPVCSLGFVEINKDITSLPPFKEPEQPTEQKKTTLPYEPTTNTEEGVGNSFSHTLLGGEPESKLEIKPAESVLRYLNKAFCSGYRYDNPTINKLIQKQLDRGFTVEDCLTVIDKKKKDWDGTDYQCNLTPMLLFSDRFESYLQQKPRRDSAYSRDRSRDRPPVSVFTNKTLVEV